jgi:hypothetical protein
MLIGVWTGCRAARRPECRLGRADSDAVLGLFGPAGSGGFRQGAEAGEDLGEQVVAGWAQGELAGVADQAGGHGEQPPPQRGDHGLAAADTVPDQPPVASGGGEVCSHPVRPAASRAPHIQARLTARWPEGR